MTATVIHTRNNPATGKLEVVAPIGTQTMSEYCQDLIAKCEQKRLAIAGPASEFLAALRADLNRMDHWLARDSAQLARQMDDQRLIDGGTFHPKTRSFVFWTTAVAMACIEVGVNKYGLDGLRASESTTWAMAVLAAAIIFIVGKVTATVIRQRPWRDGEWGDTAIALAANPVMAIAIWHIAEAREFVGQQEAAARGLAMIGGAGVGFMAMMLASYLAILALSFGQVNPSRAAEQRQKRISVLRMDLDKGWKARVEQAKRHNRLLAKANVDLEEALHDMLESSAQFRGGSKRGGVSPAYFARALSPSAVSPIHLGNMIDEHPKSIENVIARPNDDPKLGA